MRETSEELHRLFFGTIILNHNGGGSQAWFLFAGFPAIFGENALAPRRRARAVDASEVATMPEHAAALILCDLCFRNFFRNLLDSIDRKDDPEALAMFREAMKEHHNQHTRQDNNVIQADMSQGNSRSYSIDRVKREPDREKAGDYDFSVAC